MIKPLPCPFCGQSLRKEVIGRTVTYQHSVYASCFLVERGYTGLREYNVASWNTRATVSRAAVCYEVIDGTPVFNNFGQGTQADASFINKCFAFLLDHWKKNPK